MSHSMSAELRREDIVHSPEASGSSLDDMRTKHSKLPRSFSPPPPLALPTAASCAAAWTVGPQGYNIEGPTRNEKTPLLTQTGTLGSTNKHTFAEYMSMSGMTSVHPAASRPISINRLSTHQESMSDSNTDPEKEKEQEEEGKGKGNTGAGLDRVFEQERPREDSPEYLLSMSLSSALALIAPQDSRERALSGPAPEKDSNPLSLSPKRYRDPNKWANSLYNTGASPSVLRHVPSSPLSPNSKLLKVKITNMLFDLSSQVSSLPLPSSPLLSLPHYAIVRI